jgi:hypothetical protein
MLANRYLPSPMVASWWGLLTGWTEERVDCRIVENQSCLRLVSPRSDYRSIAECRSQSRVNQNLVESC